VRDQEMKVGIAVLGHGANRLAPLFALACHEAGLKTMLLDLSGTASREVSGYLDQYELVHFLYDSLRIDDSNPAIHAQLIASAYASALELSFEQEATLNSIIQIISKERGVASPASLADLIGSPDSFKNRTVDKLKIRLESLSSLNIVGDVDVVEPLLKGSAILSFRGAGSHEASEAAAALFIAKLLAMLESDGAHGPDVVILTEANRLFKARPVFRKSQRFLTSFVHAHVSKILASDSAYGLDEDYLSTCSIKILSSAAWNENEKGLVLLTPNMFMFQNHPYGYEEAFIPRDFEPRAGEPKSQAQPTGTDVAHDMKIAGRILEEIDAAHGAATRASLIAFLSAEFSTDDLERTFDRLQSERYVSIAPQNKSGRTMHTLSLTERGRSLLRRQGE